MAAEKKKVMKLTDLEDVWVQSDVLARFFGITVRQVQYLKQNGILITDNAKFPLLDSVARYTRSLSDKAQGREHKDTEEELMKQKLRAEIALKESQGELHRLKTEIAAGRYMSVEQIQMDYSKFFVAFKNWATTIPARLAGKLMGFIDPVEVRKVEKDLQDEVTRQLENFVINAKVEKTDKEQIKN